MKLFQINTQVNSGSTGRIAEDIGKVIMSNGHESFIAYGRGLPPWPVQAVEKRIDVLMEDWEVREKVSTQASFSIKKFSIETISQKFCSFIFSEDSTNISTIFPI